MIISSLCVFTIALAPPADPAERDLLERAVAVVPHPRQLGWQELEFTCFVHFGVNTFTGREWGTGTEDPAIFEPTDLDCDQWVRVAKDVGMRLVMLTVKHHDGFCLWPSAYTEHDVERSPWRDGRGDVVGELAEACRRHGLGLGVYLSPADLHEIEREDGFYGNGSPAVASVIPTPIPGRPRIERAHEYIVDDYNRYFLNQLHELLTGYGPVREVWFDGANPKPGTGQTYAYRAWYDLIRTLAPDASIVIKGPDARWCGNEAGRTRPSEWSVIPIGGTPEQWDWPDMTADDLGSRTRLREVLDGGGHLHWYPAEVNTSIRHGWFWRDERQRVKGPAEIVDVWERSVGGNAVFLLNVPPDRRGRFAKRDVATLRRAGEVLRATYGTDLAAGATARASAERHGGLFGASNALDGDASTCWMTDDWITEAELVVDLPEACTFDRIELREQIRDHGQRIESFAVDAWIEDGWREIGRGTTVGYRRILRTDALTSERVRVRILASRVGPTISHVGLYRAAE